MNKAYIKEDLQYNHYAWNVDRRDDPAGLDLDAAELDLLQGYEVLLFANTFLTLYLPDNTVDDLHGLENVFVQHLPPYITTKKDIALWIAKNLSLLQIFKKIKPRR